MLGSSPNFPYRMFRMYKRKAESQEVPHEGKHVTKKQKEEKAVVKANGTLVQNALVKTGPLLVVWSYGTGLDWLHWRALGKDWTAASRKIDPKEFARRAWLELDNFRWSNATRLFDQWRAATWDRPELLDTRAHGKCSVCTKVPIRFRAGVCLACTAYLELMNYRNCVQGSSQTKDIVTLKRLDMTVCGSYAW